MKVTYKCKCMAQETELDVPDRRQDAPIEGWMNCVLYCVSYDHAALNSGCTYEKLEYMMIPHLDDGGPTRGIGVPPEPD